MVWTVRGASSALKVGLLVGLSSWGCKDKTDAAAEQGAVPPPIESSKAGACAGGGGEVKDAMARDFFPRSAAGYCIDPNGETRSYGKDAPANLDKVCTELFDGECEVYKAHGLERVVTLRYIDGAGSPGQVSVTLSRFKDKDGAYAFFTKRVLADADPKDNAPAALEAGGAGALGSGIAYVWRGSHVAELSYANELESPDMLREKSRALLPGVAKPLGQRLPGDLTPPAAVVNLPDADRVRLGVQYAAFDVFDVSGLGPGALGFYDRAGVRYRVLSIVRRDEEAAEDVIETLRRLKGATKLKDPAGVVVGIRRDELSPQVEWLVAQRGTRVVGVGDEEYVLGEGGEGALERAKKLLLLREVLAGGGKPAQDGG